MKKKKTQQQIALELNLKKSFFSMLLKCQRNVGTWTEAQRIASLTNSQPEIWINGGGTPEQRREAIERYAA